MADSGYMLTDEDARRLVPLLENAIAEVDTSALMDATIVPDNRSGLKAAYDWAKGLRARLKHVYGV